MPEKYYEELQKLNKPLFYWLAWGGGALLILVSAWTWWAQVYLGNQNVFWGMIEANLATEGFYKKVSQESDQNNVTQEIQVSLGAKPVAESRVTLTQRQGEQEGVIVTQTIGTTTADYVRYQSVDVSGKPNTAFKDVIGLWGKTDYGTAKQGTVSGRLFNEAILNTIPIGAVSPKERAALIAAMKERKVYTVDYSSVAKKKIDGKEVYEYKVQVDPQAYVTVLQQFAKDVGIGEIAGLSPSDYADAPASTITVAVYPRSRQLARITYSDERVENYGGYGIVKQASVPEKTMSTEELQTRIQAIEQ